ncbi:MAG TPA: RDD family protein [Vicinamibacterales bacterium]
MKCPTCGYIGFEASDRCRNCGYDFTMAAQTRTAPDLPLRTEDSEGVLRDLDLAMPPANRGGSEPQPDLDRVMSSLDRVLGGPEASDLPLFESEDLPPLISADAPPRRPLAVRRTTPDPARLRPKPVRHTPRALQEPELPLRPPAPEPEPEGAPAVQVASDAPLPGAPPAARALAAIVDVGLLAAINLVVVYFTLKMCGLTTAEVRLLPPVPLVAFFLLLNGGYLAAFTAAGGQTIGKMAFGLKVVSGGDGPVPAGIAVLRAAGCLVSIVSLGLGFLPALVAAGGRAIEDRLADTRVVRLEQGAG